jgi:NitT/TauT family transport system permease protein
LGLLYLIWTQLLVPHSSPVFMAGPGKVWGRISQWAGDGSLLDMVRATLTEAALGLAIGCAAGLLLALLVAVGHQLFASVIEPAVAAIYVMPKFVLAPLFFITLGAGLMSEVVFIAIATFAVIFVNVVTGVRTVDPHVLRMMGSYGANRAQVASKVMLPHTMGYFMAALTFAGPYTITLAIAVEILFARPDGVGGTLYTRSQYFDSTGVIAALLVATALSVLLSIGANILSARRQAVSGTSPRIR